MSAGSETPSLAPGAALALQAETEALPFGDNSFGGAMAVLSDHHWRDRTPGLRDALDLGYRIAITDLTQ